MMMMMVMIGTMMMMMMRRRRRRMMTWPPPQRMRMKLSSFRFASIPRCCPRRTSPWVFIFPQFILCCSCTSPCDTIIWKQDNCSCWTDLVGGQCPLSNGQCPPTKSYVPLDIVPREKGVFYLFLFGQSLNTRPSHQPAVTASERSKFQLGPYQYEIQSVWQVWSITIIHIVCWGLGRPKWKPLSPIGTWWTMRRK